MGIAPDGTLTVLGHTPTLGFPIDTSVTTDGRFLYVVTITSLVAPAAQIDAFSVNVVTGGLTPIGATAPNLPASTQGLAAI